MARASNRAVGKRLILLACSVAAAVALIVVGLNGTFASREPDETVQYTSTSDDSSSIPSALPSPTPSRSAMTACAGTPLAKPAGDDVGAAIQKVADDYRVHVEAAWFDPDSGVQRVGETAGLEAWSTTKVPIAFAVTRQGRGEEFAHEISEALRVSDNDDAGTLWSSLGPDEASRAKAVGEVLREAGDNNTVFTQGDAGRYAFGLSIWDVADQVTFAKNMPCLTGAEQVINDLSNIDESQSWGIGTLPGAVFKGGWNLSDAGFVSRQFGWFVNDEGERVIVAVAVQASNEETADQALTAIAKVVAG